VRDQDPVSKGVEGGGEIECPRGWKGEGSVPIPDPSHTLARFFRAPKSFLFSTTEDPKAGVLLRKIKTF
jgi:hypothetical protein